MEAVSGVFKARSDAEHAVAEVRRSGIPEDRVTLLTPGSEQEIKREVGSVPVDSTEQPGMGGAVGALVGGGVGITAGAMLVALIPGVGPITALGLLGEAILGAAGATVGAVAGKKAEHASMEGLPEDEVFVYEDALRQGRSVVIAMAEDEDSAARLRSLLRGEAAESIDAAREQWWIGLRSAEENHYSGLGADFSGCEKFYRMGFEAALHARTRCMEFDQTSAEMDALLGDVRRKYPGENVEEPFTQGFQRGREYYQRMCNEKKAA